MIDYRISSPETMKQAIREVGIIPFFKSDIPGYSIKELTLPGFWFDDGDTLGPWDWKIKTYFDERGSVTIKEVRALLGVKKAAADAAIGKLQHQCRVVTGVIERVYRGPEQTYNGWLVAYFCTPESLFDDPLQTNHTPEELQEFIIDHIAELFPLATKK